ncbi:MAG: hypothetical protein ACM3Q2_08630, partial [Syntrophothermus sp.]
MKNYYFLLLCQLFYFLALITPSDYIFAQWVQTNGPGGGFVYSFAVVGNNVFAGTSGGVYFSTNNGAAWTAVNNGLPEGTSIISLSAHNNLIFAGTYKKGIFRSTDYGSNWDSVNNGLPLKELRVNGLVLRGDTVFAGVYTGNYGRVYFSADSGRSWINSSKGLPEFTTVTTLAAGNHRLFAATTDGIYRSADDSLNWLAVNKGITDKSFSSLFVKGDTIYAGTGSGGKGIYRSFDGGENWSILTTGLKETTILTITGNNGNFIAAADWKNVIFSKDGGDIWTTAGGYLPAPRINTLAVIDSSILVGTDESGVFLSTNNGSVWKAVNNGMNNSSANSMILKDSTLFAGTVTGVYTTTNNGQTWISRNQGLDSTSVKSFAKDSSNIFAVTGRGIYLSSDNGLVWSKKNNGLHASIFTSIAVTGNHIFAGTDSGIFVSTNEGSDWEPANNGMRTQVDSILRVSQLAVYGKIVFAGASGLIDGGGIYFTTEYGKNWNSGLIEYSKIGVRSFAVSKGKVFVSYTYGQLYHPVLAWSADSGKSWSWLSKGFPPYNETHKLHVIKDTVYAVSDYGTYKFSFDSTAWTNADNDFPGELLSSAFNDKYVFAGINGLGVWRRKLPDNPVLVNNNHDKQPFSFSLGQNYPNPFNPSTTILYSLPFYSKVEIKLFDILGREVITLINN